MDANPKGVILLIQGILADAGKLFYDGATQDTFTQ